MPFVTTLTLQSGDREVLQRVASEIKRTAERKGVEMRGPNAEQTRQFRVPMPKRLPGEGEYERWQYSVYTRTIRIVGHDEFARSLADREFPDSVHVDIEVSRTQQP